MHVIREMAADQEYIKLNRANWDERAPEVSSLLHLCMTRLTVIQHAKSPEYCFQRMLEDPDFMSDVVKFDVPLLGDIHGLDVVHLQCHIGTDTVSLARRGAKSVVGLDFSPASIEQGRKLAAGAASGEKVSFVEAAVYDAPSVLPAASFDLVFTGIGALCWLPDIRRWAQTVATLLKPGGRLFIREGHPMLWALDDSITDRLVVAFPYFEREQPVTWDDGTTYVELESPKEFVSKTTMSWNHGIGETVQALLDAGMQITGLAEHKSIPWDPLVGQTEPSKEIPGKYICDLMC